MILWDTRFFFLSVDFNSYHITHCRPQVSLGAGCDMILHSIVIWPLTLHPYKRRIDHAGFYPDQARWGGRGRGNLMNHPFKILSDSSRFRPSAPIWKLR